MLIYFAILIAALAAGVASLASASFAALGVGLAMIVGVVWFCISAGISLFGP